MSQVSGTTSCKSASCFWGKDKNSLSATRHKVVLCHPTRQALRRVLPRPLLLSTAAFSVAVVKYHRACCHCQAPPCPLPSSTAAPLMDVYLADYSHAYIVTGYFQKLATIVPRFIKPLPEQIFLRSRDSVSNMFLEIMGIIFKWFGMPHCLHLFNQGVTI